MKYSITVAGGLVFPPLAWAVSTQLGQVLPYVDCRAGRPWSVAATVLLALLAVVGALATLAARGNAQSRTDGFIRTISLFAGSAFAFALAMQATATLMINPCHQ
jgi:hypothetical protein